MYRDCSELQNVWISKPQQGIVGLFQIGYTGSALEFEFPLRKLSHVLKAHNTGLQKDKNEIC